MSTSTFGGSNCGLIKSLQLKNDGEYLGKWFVVGEKNFLGLTGPAVDAGLTFQCAFWVSMLLWKQIDPKHFYIDKPCGYPRKKLPDNLL